MMLGIRSNAIRKLAVLASLLVVLPASAMAQSWTYQYDAGTDMGTWLWGATERFRYNYTATQWWDFSTSGGWQTLGQVGFSLVTREQGGADPNFLGNGLWHTVGSSLSYMYMSAGDYGNWKVNDRWRFAYTYGPGQWYDYFSGTNTWSKLGPGGLASTFLGDGAWHNLNNGWSYIYSASMNQASWVTKGMLRFAYSYGIGQWYDPTTSNTLGSAGLSSAFLGDGNWHDLNNGGWSYRYQTAGDFNEWMYGTSVRFKYSYILGQWYASDTAPGTWSTLGAGNMTSAFIGDGRWHNLNDGWSYTYAAEPGADYG